MKHIFPISISFLIGEKLDQISILSHHSFKIRSQIEF